MNGTPGFSVVPGETCMRPCGWSMVIGSIQIHEPSSVRQNAFLTSRSSIVAPEAAPTISRLRAEYIMRRTKH